MSLPPQGGGTFFRVHPNAGRILKTMDISRAEQRILHLLAQGGRIELTRDDNRKIQKLQLFTREGWVFSGLDIVTFRKLKQKKAIRSTSGRPYRITERGLVLVRADPNNR